MITKPRIAVVEDDKDIRETWQYVFEDAGYEVLCAAENGDLFLDFLKNGLMPDLMLIDIWLTEWKHQRNGNDIAKEVKAMYPNIKILFVSAISRCSYDFFITGNGFVHKPCTVEEVLKAVEIIWSGSSCFPKYVTLDYLPKDPRMD